MRIGVYVRVSSTSQSEQSQVSALRKYLASKFQEDADKVRWYIDKAQSGDDLDRPAFADLQKDVFRGDIDTVVVHKLDRLSRSMKDGIDVICGWVEQGVRVISVTQEIDLSGTIGRLIAAVLFAVAEMEQETRRERQAAGIAVAKAEGKYRGRKPGTHKANPRRAAELRRSGLTIGEIAKSLGVSTVTVHSYLKLAAAPT